MAKTAGNVIIEDAILKVRAGVERGENFVEPLKATQVLLCDGDETALRFVTEELVVGQALGAVDPGVPTVPLEADLPRPAAARLRVRREANPQPARPGPAQAAATSSRSVLFHRLRVLELDWVRPAESQVAGRGHLPRDLAVVSGGRSSSLSLVEAAAWGTTVADRGHRQAGRHRRQPARWSS